MTRTEKQGGGLMEKIMAVYDVDPAYARRFADVTNQKERVPFDVIDGGSSGIWKKA